MKGSGWEKGEIGNENERVSERHRECEKEKPVRIQENSMFIEKNELSRD